MSGTFYGKFGPDGNLSYVDQNGNPVDASQLYAASASDPFGGLKLQPGWTDGGYISNGQILPSGNPNSGQSAASYNQAAQNAGLPGGASWSQSKPDFWSSDAGALLGIAAPFAAFAAPAAFGAGAAGGGAGAATLDAGVGASAFGAPAASLGGDALGEALGGGAAAGLGGAGAAGTSWTAGAGLAGLGGAGAGLGAIDTLGVGGDGLAGAGGIAANGGLGATSALGAGAAGLGAGAAGAGGAGGAGAAGTGAAGAATAGTALTRIMNGTAGAADYLSLGLPLAGAALGGLNGSKPAGTTTTTTNVPDWQQPYIQNLLGQSGAALSQSQSYAGANQGLVNAGGQQLQDTISGKYLDPNSNPYLSNMYNAAADQVKNQVNSNFEGSGRYGSGAQTGELGYQLGNLASNMYGNAYQQGRTQQLTAATAAPGYATSAAQSPFAPLQAYQGIVGQPYGTATSTPYFTNPTGGALSGALAGYGLSKAFG
jgi:hypothetical protein